MNVSVSSNHTIVVVGENISIYVLVIDNSTPQNNTLVNFSTTLGNLSAASAYTNSSGIATVLLNSTTSGTATINASTGSVYNTTNVSYIAGVPHTISTLYDDEYTVNTTSELSVWVYDIYENPVSNITVIFNATPPSDTLFNSPFEYNSWNLTPQTNITNSEGRTFTNFRTDKRSGDNLIYITVANTTLNTTIAIKGIADRADNIMLYSTPSKAYANNVDTYKISAGIIDKFYNPVLPNCCPIKEQVCFTGISGSTLIPLNIYGVASTLAGPTPYLEKITITATYKNATGYTNVTNSTDLSFFSGDLSRFIIYANPDTVLSHNLSGNHDTSITIVALDEWGHTLPNISILLNNTDTSLGNLTVAGVNTTNLVNTSTDQKGKIYADFTSKDLAGDAMITVTCNQVNISVNASTVIHIRNEPFLSISISAEPDVVDSGDTINVTTIISVEGELPVSRSVANAVLVLDRSGSMDPDYYAGTPLDVALVLDRSGSMQFLGTDPQQPMTDAKTAAKVFMDNLVSNAQVGVVAFESSSNIEIGLTLLNSSNNRTLIRNTINDIYTGGGTAIGDGMADGNSMLINGRDDARKIMILLTDGECTSGSDRDCTIAIANANLNGITVYTIGLGSQSYIDEPLLERIASETGGTYYNAPTSSELGDVYNSIAQEISDYDITVIKYGEEGFTPYDYEIEGNLDLINTTPPYFEDTFQINETINDFKALLRWNDNSADLNLGLISPGGHRYSLSNDTTGYYSDDREAVPIDVRCAEFDTYVYSADPDTTFADQTSFYVTDHLNNAADQACSVLQWKLPDAPTHNARITGVTLYLRGLGETQTGWDPAGDTRSINIYDLTTGYNDPTWNCNSTPDTWVSGSFSTSDYNTSYLIDSVSLSSSIQNDLVEFNITNATWDSDRSPDWGEECNIVLAGNGYSGTDADPSIDRFASGEYYISNGLNNWRPLVTITYSIPRDTSEYIWIHPLSYTYPNTDNDTLEIGNWSIQVTGSGDGTDQFNITTYIDKKSAAQLASHAFISSFDENRGDRAGLVLYSNDNISRSINQISYLRSGSTWVGYFTVNTGATYYFNLSWADTSDFNISLYEGTTVLDSSTGISKPEVVSAPLFPGTNYNVVVSCNSNSDNDTQFTINVSNSPLRTAMSIYYDSISGGGVPRYRQWDGQQWSNEASANFVGGRIRWITAQSCPVRNEIVMGTLDDQKDLNIQIWDGTSWGSVEEFSTIANSNNHRGFDIAYEQNSGDAMIVYRNSDISTCVPRYRIWDGLAWSSEDAVNSTDAGSKNIQWVRLAAKPNSDEIALVFLNSDDDLRAQVWDGSSWSNVKVLTTNARTYDYQCFDVVYEQETGNAVVVWSDQTAGAVRSCTWNGTSWSAESNIYSYSNSVYWIKLASDPNSTKILLGALDSAYDIRVSAWNGSVWTTVDQVVEYDTTGYNRRYFDVGFEQISGTGIIMWSDDTPTPKYQLLNASDGSWGPEYPASSIGTNYVSWVQLTMDPFADNIFLMTSDGDNDINIQQWNESTWNAPLEFKASSDCVYECFDLVYSNQNITTLSTPVSWTEWYAMVESTLNNDSLGHLSNSINTITADGLTAIDEGIYVANNELSTITGNSTMVLMTDGIDNAGYHSLMLEAERARKNNTVIYTIGFGNNESEVDPVLSDIANITGGEYYFAPSAAILKNIFRGIAANITNFTADGPELNIVLPHNYITDLSLATATYVVNSSNATTDNASEFIPPTYPNRGNAEPNITTAGNETTLLWNLPSLNPGEKWGVWYQLVIQGAGYVPLILPGSNIAYTDVNGTNITVNITYDGGSDIGGTGADVNYISLAYINISANPPVVLIGEPSGISIIATYVDGNPAIAYVILYSNLGYFNDDFRNPFNITVSGSDCVNFASIKAGQANINALGSNANNSKTGNTVIMVRPKGKITIS